MFAHYLGGKGAEWAAWGASYWGAAWTSIGHLDGGDPTTAAISALNNCTKAATVGKVGTMASLWAAGKYGAAAGTAVGPAGTVAGFVAGVGTAWVISHLWDYSVGQGADYLANSAFDRSTRGAFMTPEEVRSRLENRGFSPADIRRLTDLYAKGDRTGFWAAYTPIVLEMEAREEAESPEEEARRLEEEAFLAYVEELKVFMNGVMRDGDRAGLYTDPRSPVRVPNDMPDDVLVPVTFGMGGNFLNRLAALRSDLQRIRRQDMDFEVTFEVSPVSAQVVDRDRSWRVVLPLGEHALSVTATWSGIHELLHSSPTRTFTAAGTILIVKAQEEVRLSESHYQTTDGTPVTFRATASQLEENITYAYSWTVGEQTHTGPSPTWTLTPRLSDPEQQEQRVVQVSLYDVRCGTIVAEASAALTILPATQPLVDPPPDRSPGGVCPHCDGRGCGGPFVTCRPIILTTEPEPYPVQDRR